MHTKNIPQTRSAKGNAKQKKAELPLEQRERQLSDAQQIAQLGSWEWEIPSGEMIWSDEMFRIMGYEPDSVSPTFGIFLGTMHPEDRPLAERRINDALLHPSCVEFEYRAVKHDGSARSIHCRAEILVESEGDPIRMIGTAHDVTELRRFAAGLTSQVEQLQQLAAASVAIYSAEGLEETLEVATSHALRIVGARRGCGSIADPGEPGESLVHLSDDPELDPAAGKLLAAVEPLHDSIRVARNAIDADPRFAGLSVADRAPARAGWMVVPLVDVLGGGSGAIQLFEKQRGDFTAGDEALVAQIAQITSLALQKARLFEDLQLSQGRYRRLFDAHLSGDFVISMDGTFLEVNPALARILGYASVEKLKSVNVTSVYREASELERVLERIRKDGRALQQETEFVRADGTPVFVIINLVGVLNRDSELVGLQGCLFDVTEWKGAEAALRESQQQLLQSQKLEAVGQLAGGIAHDFNNMLMAIQGFANLLEEEIPPTPAARAHLGEIRKAADRSARLTRQLLAYSRKQVLQPEVIELNGIIAGMEDMLKRLIGEHILYVSKLDSATGRVHADPGQLQQVLMNLVLNARDAMIDGGELTVRTGARRVARSTHMGDFTLPPGEYAVLTVTDTGRGIPASILPRIFEPFFTTKAVGLGSGLGLSTVYGIVKQSGGYIHANSTADEGSSFTIFLPRTETVATTPPGQFAGPGGESRGSATVLIAEDESVLRSLVGIVLRRSGFKVIEAEDGMEALRMAEGIEYEIDVLVTDLVMPRMGGEPLAAALLDRCPALKVVFMSGYAEEVVARQGLITEGSVFLEKPFAPNVLVRAVQDILSAQPSD